jgi:hypothetical protein
VPIITPIFPLPRKFITAFTMKGLAVQALLSALVIQAALIPPKINNTRAIDWKLEQKRQALGTLTWLIGMWSWPLLKIG